MCIRDRVIVSVVDAALEDAAASLGLTGGAIAPSELAAVGVTQGPGCLLYTSLNCLAKIAIDGIDSNPEMYRREMCIRDRGERPIKPGDISFSPK